MPTTLTIKDETAAGDVRDEMRLDIEEKRITVRELIRRRVFAEAERFNNSEPGYFRGLVQPREAEATLNGYKLREARRIDPDEQFEKACRAFERNGFFIIIDEEQVETLDQEIAMTPQHAVSFVKLVPLVGG